MGVSRSFDLSIAPSTAQWPTYLYYTDKSVLMATDDNGDGVWDWVNDAYTDPATGLPYVSLLSGKTATVYVQKLVPTTADSAVLDTTMLTMSPSGQSSTTSSATLKTDTPFSALVVKTFYMHPSTLDTAPDKAASASTPVSAIFSMWSQTPAFADNFNITGTINVPLYYTTSSATGSMPITVTLFYTNGASNTVQIGSSTVTLPFSTSVALYNFAIAPAGGSITIPKGSYLVLKIDNIQTTTLNVYHDSTHKTCVQVNTPTYVHVSDINTYDGAVSTTNFAPGDSLHVTANVNDPIGAYDIPSARISVTGPTGTVIVNNQLMTNTVTDPSSPALWKTFDYPAFALSNTYPSGVYTITVTGYESNGVTHTKTTQIVLMSPTAGVLISPNNMKSTAPNTVWTFKHTVTNLNSYKNDVFDISYTATIQGWSVKLFKADGVTPLLDTDHDGTVDTGTVGPLNSADVIMQVSVPSYANPADTDVVSVTARSSNDVSKSSTATDTVFITTNSVVKTLYLHEQTVAAGGYLDTSPASSTITQVAIGANKDGIWTQSPAFARAFNILDDPSVTLYLYNPNNAVSGTMVATLKYVNGGTTTTIGSWSGAFSVARRSTATLNFDILLTNPNTNIPAGSKLIIDIRPTQAITVYQLSTSPSHIDMDTQSYINVQSVSITDTNSIPITSATPPNTVKVFSTVTDPFGSYDIVGATVSVQDADGNIVQGLGPYTMSLLGTDTSNPSVWKNYERDIVLPSTLDTGTYNFVVTATESNGVINKMGTPLAVTYPVKVTASKSFANSGGDSFLVTIKVTNNDAAHTVNGVYAYDFYSSGFTDSGFNVARSTAPVNDGILSGTINIMGPLSLPPGKRRPSLIRLREAATITCRTCT